MLEKVSFVLHLHIYIFSFKKDVLKQDEMSNKEPHVTNWYKTISDLADMRFFGSANSFKDDDVSMKSYSPYNWNELNEMISCCKDISENDKHRLTLRVGLYQSLTQHIFSLPNYPQSVRS